MSKLIVVLAAVALALTMTQLASADTLYRYTGNPLAGTTRGFACSPGCKVTVSFTVARPLAPNLAFSMIIPETFIFRSGTTSISGTGLDPHAVAFVSTDVQGKIKKWVLFAEVKTGPSQFRWVYTSNAPENPLHLAFPNGDISALTTLDPLTYHDMPPGDFLAEASNARTPGVWKVMLPEAGTLFFVGTGLLSIAGLVRRKWARAASVTAGAERHAETEAEMPTPTAI